MTTYPGQQGRAAKQPAEGLNRPDLADVERTQYIMDLANTFEVHGREILKKVREDEPEKFWSFISGVMRWDEALRLAPALSDDELDLVVDRVVAGLRQGMPDGTRAPAGRGGQ
jgi:hypothetical protein